MYFGLFDQHPRSWDRVFPHCSLAPDSPHGLFVDMLKKMLSYDPEQRISPEEALQHPFLAAYPEKDVVCARPKSLTEAKSPVKPMSPAHGDVSPTCVVAAMHGSVAARALPSAAGLPSAAPRPSAAVAMPGASAAVAMPGASAAVAIPGVRLAGSLATASLGPVRRPARGPLRAKASADIIVLDRGRPVASLDRIDRSRLSMSVNRAPPSVSVDRARPSASESPLEPTRDLWTPTSLPLLRSSASASRLPSAAPTDQAAARRVSLFR